jgi:hypothetical protein
MFLCTISFFPLFILFQFSYPVSLSVLIMYAMCCFSMFRLSELIKSCDEVEEKSFAIKNLCLVSKIYGVLQMCYNQVLSEHSTMTYKLHFQIKQFRLLVWLTLIVQCYSFPPVFKISVKHLCFVSEEIAEFFKKIPNTKIIIEKVDVYIFHAINWTLSVCMKWLFLLYQSVCVCNTSRKVLIVTALLCIIILNVAFNSLPLSGLL